MARSSAQLLCGACLAGGLLLLQGCSSSPVRSPPSSSGVPASASSDSIGNEIVIRALSLLGAPYKYGGSGPKAFDCSGLVHFIYEELGVEVPRTAAAQYSAAKHVSIDDLEPGDLLFFRLNGRRVSHVAIYAGDGRFVHAPKTGRPVELRALDEYYRPRLAGVGRLF